MNRPFVFAPSRCFVFRFSKHIRTYVWRARNTIGVNFIKNFTRELPNDFNYNASVRQKRFRLKWKRNTGSLCMKKVCDVIFPFRFWRERNRKCFVRDEKVNALATMQHSFQIEKCIRCNGESIFTAPYGIFTISHRCVLTPGANFDVSFCDGTPLPVKWGEKWSRKSGANKICRCVLSVLYWCCWSKTIKKGNMFSCNRNGWLQFVKR